MIKRIIYIILTLVVMVSIFCFSAQPTDESNEVSEGFTSYLLRLMPHTSDWSDAQILAVAESINGAMRKLAHFMIYAALGFFAFLTAKTYRGQLKKKWLYCLLVCFLYAVSDEIHQVFVPGRWGSIWDVLLDFAGSNVGVVLVYCIGRIKNRILKRVS